MISQLKNNLNYCSRIHCDPVSKSRLKANLSCNLDCVFIQTVTKTPHSFENADFTLRGEKYTK